MSLDSDKLPSYTALSYVWGQNVQGKYRISLDGSVLDITPNLDATLRTLSQLEDLSYQWLWIDAICINQDDSDERSFQVTLMRDLYSRAKRTIAYLGPEDDGTELGLSWLEQIDAARSLPEPSAWLEDAATSFQYDSEWSSLNSLFGRQWWSRAWILQETIVSPDLVFVFGKKMVTEKTLINALWFLRLCYQNIGIALLARGFWMNGWSVPFNAIYKRFQLRGWHHEHRRLSLGSILSQRYEFYASDPRDYIYAIFSLVEDTGGLVTSPNYNLSVWKVYASLVRSYTQVYANLDIICLAGSPRELQELPSWAPDLQIRNESDGPFIQEDCLWLMNLDAEEALKADEQKQQSQRVHTASYPTSEWNATYRASGLSIPDVTFSEDLRILTAQAVYIDVVDGTAGCQGVVNSTTRGQTRSSFIAPNLQPQHRCSAYGTAEATKEAIWRTMLFDRIPTFQTQRAPDYAAALLAYGCAKAGAGQGDATWRSVWNAMKDFEVDGVSLRDWICGGIDPCTAEKQAAEATKLHLESIKGREYDPTRLEDPVIPSCLQKLLVMQRRLFVTNGGYIGVAPLDSRRGDEVWIIHGCNIPVLLRKADEDYREIVGECYVHGLMYGEVMQDLETGRRTASRVILK